MRCETSFCFRGCLTVSVLQFCNLVLIQEWFVNDSQRSRCLATPVFAFKFQLLFLALRLIHTYGQKTTNGQSNLTKKAASPPHVDHSMAWWRQCAPHLIRASLNPPESTSQTASRLVQLLCKAHGRRWLYFTMGRPFPPQNYHFALGDLDACLMHGSLGPTESTSQTTYGSIQQLLQGSQLWQTERLTHWPGYFVCNNRPQLRT